VHEGNEKFTPKPGNYSELRLYDIYPIADLSDVIAKYRLEGADYANIKVYENMQSKLKWRMLNIIQNNIICGSLAAHYIDDTEISDDGCTYEDVKIPCVKLAEFASWAAAKNLKCPSEISELCTVDKIPAANDMVDYVSSRGADDDTDAYEDIISDETIMKLKNLTLPQMKQQVAMLSEEKKKSDAAIMAAAKIGLIFYEYGLQKPTTETKFKTEYKKHLDNFPELQDTTITRIYKNLPEGYRHSRGGGRVACKQINLSPIIKAALYAGSIYDTDDVKDLEKLKTELAQNKYDLPPDEILLMIIDAIEDI